MPALQPWNSVCGFSSTGKMALLAASLIWHCQSDDPAEAVQLCSCNCERARHILQPDDATHVSGLCLMLFVLCTEGLHWLGDVRLLVSGDLLVA